MDNAPEFKGRKLVILRLVAITMVIAAVNQVYLGCTAGVIEFGKPSHMIVLTGDYLWLGFVFMIINSAFFVLLIFINHKNTQAFKKLAKIFSCAWFVVLTACVFVVV